MVQQMVQLLVAVADLVVLMVAQAKAEEQVPVLKERSQVVHMVVVVVDLVHQLEVELAVEEQYVSSGELVVLSQLH